MSVPAFEPVAIPLRPDDFGGLRVADTRVLLELIVRAYDAGATPEEIVQAYDVLKLRDVYAIIAWCLSNEAAVNEYMAERERQSASIREELESIRPAGRELLKSLRTRQLEAEWRAEATKQLQLAAHGETATPSGA
jgi:uncharacterized protein (DUF433 family)